MIAEAKTVLPPNRSASQPLGISIIGGLLVSQVLTLYTTPVIYIYLDRFRRRDRDSHSRLARAMGGLEARA